MVKVVFPDRAGGLSKNLIERYYITYYRYVLNIFKYVKADIKFVGDTSVADAVFWIKVNGKKIMIDYSDYLKIDNKAYKDPNSHGYFKFHLSTCHTKYNKAYSLPPISFYDWEQYYALKKEIKYTGSGTYIINRQKPYGNARIRRAGVQAIITKFMKAIENDHPLKKRVFQVGIQQQIEFWRDINKSRMAIFVPGCRNNMLDRGHIQYMAFGCPTICPPIINKLPYEKQMLPKVHYIECSEDYLDIIDKIKWVDSNIKECKKIGNYAKMLFEKTSTPDKVVNWILEKIGEEERVNLTAL